MHDTAYEIGKKFFDLYWSDGFSRILDVGSRDVNGTLRCFCPPDAEYVGVDIEPGKGVDVVIAAAATFPFVDKSFDIVLSTSCFEHDQMFWQTFAEMARVLTPGGYIYINVPSNGNYHSYPYDNWRFYPDAGLALETWSRKIGLPLKLAESFTARRNRDIWNDFVMVFEKPTRGGNGRRKYLSRYFADALNIRCSTSESVRNFSNMTEDQLLLEKRNANASELAAKIRALEARVGNLTAKLEARELGSTSKELMGEVAVTVSRRKSTPKKKTLEQLYNEHRGKVSDKWSSYLTEYERISEEYRDKPVRLLEIGIQNGGSLEIWSKVFPNARKLVGCDINPDCARLSYEDPRVALVVGDCNADATEAAILGHAPSFDIIIDDGSHRSNDIVKSFARYFHHLAYGGVFVAEDLCCSYWREFEGGLNDPFSSITFFKRLADIINQEHWGLGRLRTDLLSGFFSKYGFYISEEDLSAIHSVQFMNSLCIVRKDIPERNRLNARVIAGSEERVYPGCLKLHSSYLTALDQTQNAWSARSTSPGNGEIQVAACEDIYKKVQHLLQEKRTDEAIAELERLLTTYPSYALAHNDLGVLYLNRGNHDRALMHYETAVKLNPSHVTFQKNLADLYFAVLNRLEDARGIYLKVLEMVPDDVEALTALGRIYTALHQFEDAGGYYLKIIEIEPGNTVAQQQLQYLKTAHQKAPIDRHAPVSPNTSEKDDCDKSPGIP